MKSIRETVRNNIRRLRQSAGLSQQKLAERTGKSLRYVNYLENTDSNVTIEVLQQLAEGMGVSVSALVTDPLAGPEMPPRETEAGLRYMNALIGEKLAALELHKESGAAKSKDGGKKKVK